MKLKTSLLLAAQFSILGSTAFILIATSPAPPTCPASGPVRYAVTSTCGPSGYINVSNDTACQLSVTGAEAVNLPSEGAAVGSVQQGFALMEYARYENDGGFADGGQSVANPDGGAPLRFFHCNANPSGDGGTISVLDLDCQTEDGVQACAGTLVEEGPLADAGTDGGAP